MFYSKKPMADTPTLIQEQHPVTTPFGEGFIVDTRTVRAGKCLARLVILDPTINGRKYANFEVELIRQDFPLIEVPSVTEWKVFTAELTKAAEYRVHKWLEENSEMFDVYRAPYARKNSRLDYLRREIEAQRISWGEVAELQSLADQIDPGDVLLLEWAGVPEHPEAAAS